MENVRQVFEQYGKNASEAERGVGIIYDLNNVSEILVIPISDIINGRVNNDSDQLIELEEFCVVSYNEDGDVFFVKREFSKDRFIEISSDHYKNHYLCYIDFGNDKFDIVLCDKVVF